MTTFQSFALKNDVSDKAEIQLKELIDKHQKYIIRAQMMPDAHYCNGAVPVGTILQIKDAIDPDWVSADIGCGVTVFNLVNFHIEYLPKLTEALQNISHKVKIVLSQDVQFIKNISSNIRFPYPNEVYQTLGTIGGGNHFVEIGEFDKHYYLIVHSGSRGFGGHTYRAFKNVLKHPKDVYLKEIIELLKKSNHALIINDVVQLYKNNHAPSNLLFGEDMEDYMKMVDLTIYIAYLNRLAIAQTVVNALRCDYTVLSDTAHNGITCTENKDIFVQKGAIVFNKFDKDKIYAIPINMRDGTLLVTKKPNTEWLGLPHGAGRLLSRKAAKDQIKMEDYQQMMEGICAPNLSLETIDEAPTAYKTLIEIKNQIKESCKIIGIIKPIYSFKCKE